MSKQEKNDAKRWRTRGRELEELNAGLAQRAIEDTDTIASLRTANASLAERVKELEAMYGPVRRELAASLAREAEMRCFLNRSLAQMRTEHFHLNLAYRKECGRDSCRLIVEVEAALTPLGLNAPSGSIPASLRGDRSVEPLVPPAEAKQEAKPCVHRWDTLHPGGHTKKIVGQRCELCGLCQWFDEPAEAEKPCWNCNGKSHDAEGNCAQCGATPRPL